MCFSWDLLILRNIISPDVYMLKQLMLAIKNVFNIELYCMLMGIFAVTGQTVTEYAVYILQF